MLPDFPAGTRVKLNGRGLAIHRKLSAWGTSGGRLRDGLLTSEEAIGTFTWLGTDDGRPALLRSDVTQREGMIERSLMRKA